jgi:multidrug efflux pump subunit AcrB
MTKRIFRIIFAAALLAAVLASALIMLTLVPVLHPAAGGPAQGGPPTSYTMARETDEAAYFRNFHGDSRVTLVAPDGTVLYDSTATPSRWKTT